MDIPRYLSSRMRNHLNITTALLGFILSATLSAQPRSGDSTTVAKDTTKISYFNYSFDSTYLSPRHAVTDSMLAGFQRYNPAEQGSRFFTSMGNPGLAARNIVYYPSVSPLLQFAPNVFSLYTYNAQNTRYYDHAVPISYLEYTNGSKKEQLFRAMLGVKLGKIVSLAADFKLIHSPGTYPRHKSDDKSISFSGQYFTKNKRYGIIAHYTHNKFIVMENGGISNDTVFEEDLETDRRLIDVNLDDAQNMVKISSTGLNQYLFLSGSDTLHDSTQADRRAFHAGRVSHSFEYSRQILLYTDGNPLSDFYAGFDSITDSVRTYDSTYFAYFRNRLAWSNMAPGQSLKDKYIYLELAFTHQYTSLGGYLPDTGFTQLMPEATMILRPWRTGTFNFRGTYTLGDDNESGFRLSGSFSQEIATKRFGRGILSAEASIENQATEWFYRHYSSNHFRWANPGFEKERILQLGLKYHMDRLTADIRLYNCENYVYMNQQARPAQYGDAIQVVTASLVKPLRWKVWNLDLNLAYQHALDESVLRLPLFIGRATFYPSLNLFKNAALFQPGLDVLYFTKYYADAYMPALRQFYLQDEKKIGNFFVVDLYASLKVKSFRIFAKMQHINAYWSKNDYYLVPHYPLQDAAFKFGLSWAFFD